MFAEELGGNATKRRQEEARARRRKLKQQEEQKKKADERATLQQTAAAERATLSGSIPSPIVSSSSIIASGGGGGAAAAVAVLEIPVATEESQNIAVKNAMQLRLQRQAVQRQVQAAATIQSVVRMHQSNTVSLSHHSTLLGQRLQDLRTLTNLLKQ